MFALDKLCFPVNIGKTHWAMSVVFMQNKSIRFYDSHRGDGTLCLENLLICLKDEQRHKKTTNRGDWDKWKLIGYTEDIFRQHNGGCVNFFCLFI